MRPDQYPTYKIFEKGLTKADVDNQCKELGYSAYDSTVTHGALNIKMTLDLYDHAPESEVVVVKEPADECCNVCEVEGEVKYYSIDTRHNMCGECCMNPKDYNLYHIFEKGLTLATNPLNQCEELGYPAYDSTVTHGAMGITMTLDLYNPVEATMKRA